jgi:C4-type Zn-finger protein
MNKRFLSTLLFGALFIASTSVFVSCKDYDDDINSLQAQIDQKADKTALEQAKTDLKAEIASLKSQLEAKDAELTTLINSNKADIQSEITRAKAAEAALEARIATAEAAIKRIDGVLAGKVDQSEYDAEVKKIYAQISAVDTKLTGALERIATLEKGLKDEETARLAVAADLEQQKLALQKLIERLDDTEADLKAKIEAADKVLQNQINDLTSDSATNTTDIASLKKSVQGINTQITEIINEIAVLNVFATNQVRSLVFSPSMYFGGIEGVALPALNNYPLLAKSGDEYTPNGTKLNISLGGIAQYWVNPSTADLENYKLTFFSNKAVTRAGMNYVTSDSAKITNYFIKDYYKNGILSVPFHADFDKITKLGANEIPIMALQLSKGDTIVTSDFAIVKPIEYSNLKIADKDYFVAGKCNTTDDINTPVSQHLHEVFADMKPTTIPATVVVAYDGEVDLLAKVETHFDMKDLDGNVTTDIKMGDADFKALGLEYIFEPVDYTVGANRTSESVHIVRKGTIIENGLVKPCSVTEDGKQNESSVGTETARAAIGKLPVVRVRLVSDNKTLAVGYFKIKIMDKVKPVEPIEDPAPIDNMFSNCPDLYDNCASTPNQVFTMTWAQIEANVYAKLALSKEEFETEYELDHTIDNAETTNSAGQKIIENADQYTYQVVDNKNKYTQITNKLNYIGTVKELADPNDPTTNVLQWTLSESDYGKLLSKAKYIDAQGNYTTEKDKVVAKVYPEELNTIVRFTKDKGLTTEEHIFVRLSIPKNKIHFAVAKIEDTKALAYWFKMNQTTNADNSAEAFDVRMNVPVPTNPYTPLLATEYTKDLHNYFIDNSVRTALLDATHFSNFANKIPEFQFTTPQAGVNASFSGSTWQVDGQSGAKYTLTVNGTRDQIITSAGATVIASLNKTTGVISYADNKVAHDILNYVPASKLGERESFTAYIQIVVKGDCYDVDLISDQYFNVRFLRPVNFESVAHKAIKDAPNDWQTVDFTQGAKISDWRGYVENGTYSGSHFDDAYYGIELLIKGSTQVDMLKQIRTDANMGKSARMVTPGSDEEIAAYYKKCVSYDKINGLELRFASPTDNSKLQYKNNSGVTDNFNIIVPVSMKYTFGKYEDSYQTHYLVITVAKSEGQDTDSRRQ